MAAPDSMRVVKRPPKMIKFPKKSAMDLLVRTSLGDRQRSKSVAISKILRIAPPRRFPEWSAYRVKCYNKDNGHNHFVHVFTPDKSISSDSLVVVNCDCPQMVYMYEVCNAKRTGSSFIMRSNGEDSHEKNPAQLIGLCKHSYLALRYLAKRGDRNKKARENSNP